MSPDEVVIVLARRLGIDASTCKGTSTATDVGRQDLTDGNNAIDRYFDRCVSEAGLAQQGKPTKASCITELWTSVYGKPSVDVKLSEDLPAHPGQTIVTQISIDEGNIVHSEADELAYERQLRQRYGKPTFLQVHSTLDWCARPVINPNSLSGIHECGVRDDDAWLHATNGLSVSPKINLTDLATIKRVTAIADRYLKNLASGTKASF